MTRLRLGVMSTANIATEQVIPGIQQFSERCEVVAIASRAAAVADQVATGLGITTAYGSYEELLADPEIDAVYIPLPNHLHAEWTMKAADAGKHILCEKPLALNAAEALEMVEHCARAGVKLQEAFMYRFHPQWQHVKHLVSSGAIGELRAVQSWFSYFNDDPDNIRNIPGCGGGSVMDVGCYSINLSRWLFGSEPDQVFSLVRRDPAFGTDIVTSALLGFGDGQASFTCSTLAESDQRVHVVGTRGRIEIEIAFNTPNDRPARVFVTSGGNPPVAPATEVVEFAPADQYGLQADAFAAAVLDDIEMPFPPEDAVANMAVIDAVLAG